MVIAALQDCRRKFSCLTGNILAHPASPGCEYRFLLQQRGRILIAIGFLNHQPCLWISVYKSYPPEPRPAGDRMIRR
jgi:hypothetical protein